MEKIACETSEYVFPEHRGNISCRVEATGHRESAHRAASVCSNVLEYARISGMCEFNAAANLSKVLAKADHKKRASITDPKDLPKNKI